MVANGDRLSGSMAARAGVNTSVRTRSISAQVSGPSGENGTSRCPVLRMTSRRTLGRRVACLRLVADRAVEIDPPIEAEAFSARVSRPSSFAARGFVVFDRASAADIHGRRFVFLGFGRDRELPVQMDSTTDVVLVVDREGFAETDGASARTTHNAD